MKDSAREAFRWAPHTAGTAVIKPKDYEAAGDVEAPTPYAAWKILAETGQSLQPGDVLEGMDAFGAPVELQIAKYIGFDAAEWLAPSPKPDPDPHRISQEILNSK